MKLISKDIDKRLSVKLDKSITVADITGIYNFGTNNDYPDTIERIVNGSITAKNVSDIYTRFLVGQGFEYLEVNNEIVGSDSRGKKIKVIDLLRQVAKSLSIFNGCYLNVNYNLNFKITTVNHIPFKFCRFCKPDDSGYSSMIAIYNNWPKDSDFKFDKSKIKDFFVFNYDKAVITSQIKKCGSIEKYSGQIYHLFLDNQYFYPLSPFDPVYLDCDSEQQVAVFKNNTTRNGMLKKTIARFATPSTDEEAIELKRKWDNFIGVDGDSMMGLFQDPDPVTGKIESGQDFQIDSIDSNIDDKMFEGWQKELSNNIRKAQNVPAMLIDYDDNKLSGTSGESIIQATNYYNQLTSDIRTEISGMFAEIFKNSANPVLANCDNWKIKPLKLYDTELATTNSDKTVVTK